jgi:hypothetical protein
MQILDTFVFATILSSWAENRGSVRKVPAG